MIKPLNIVKMLDLVDREVWFFPKICIIGLRLKLLPGQTKWLYSYNEGDFVSGHMELGEVTELKTCTMVVPGGEILLHNSSLVTPTVFEGSVEKIGHGIHVVGDVHLEGIKESLVLCVGPRENMKGFEDKDMEWVIVRAGETYTFGESDIGFALIYDDANVFRSYSVEAGDVFTAETDSVLGVIFRKGGRG